MLKIKNAQGPAARLQGHIHDPADRSRWIDMRHGQKPVLYTARGTTSLSGRQLSNLLLEWLAIEQTNELKEVQS